MHYPLCLNLILMAGCAVATALKENNTCHETKRLPRSPEEFLELTKSVLCSNDTYPHYVVSSSANKTYICCNEKRKVFGLCFEFNELGKIVQPSPLADCTKYQLSPCGYPYISTDSYKIFQCFENYGGMLSPSQEEKRYQNCLLEIKQKSGKLDENIRQKLEIKEDLKDARKQRDWGLGAFGVVLVLFVLVLIYILKRKIQQWRGRRNFGMTTSNSSKKTSTKGKTDGNTIDEEGQNMLDQLANLMVDRNPNDYQPVSEAIPASEDNSVTTREATNMTHTYVAIGTEKRIRQHDMQKAMKQQESKF